MICKKFFRDRLTYEKTSTNFVPKIKNIEESNFNESVSQILRELHFILSNDPSI